MDPELLLPLGLKLVGAVCAIAILVAAFRRFRRSSSFNRVYYAITVFYCVGALVAMALTSGAGGSFLSAAMGLGALPLWLFFLLEAQLGGTRSAPPRR